MSFWEWDFLAIIQDICLADTLQGESSLKFIQTDVRVDISNYREDMLLNL